MTARLAPTPGRCDVPLLVTVDVEIAHDRDLAHQRAMLERLAIDWAGLPATWFCTATAAETFSAPLRTLARQGHTIGCHGLEHGAWEDYRTFDREAVAGALRSATDRIERAIGVRPLVFRGPRMTTSATTQDVLVGLGYRADFSVSAHRFDPFAASAYQLQWLRMPPTPYQPSVVSPFQRGDRALVVVPLSGLGAPFLSGVLYIVGQQAMRTFGRSLAERAARGGAPLVYLLHSYEFTGLAMADLRPWHHRLYRRDPEQRYRLNVEFVRWLIGDLGLQAVSASQFLSAKGVRYAYDAGLSGHAAE
jgi:polysaccharide deacetylase